jgi:hypothetical protein
MSLMERRQELSEVASMLVKLTVMRNAHAPGSKLNMRFAEAVCRVQALERELLDVIERRQPPRAKQRTAQDFDEDAGNWMLDPDMESKG